MIKGLNPWEMGTETNSGPLLPNFCEGRFIVVKIAPPKEKTIKDGLVLTALMTSFIDSSNKEVKTVEVEESPNGYSIRFPMGKRGLIATKYRGPRSLYKFKNPETGKFYQIPAEKFTAEFAYDYLNGTLPNWDQLKSNEQDQLINEYLEDMFTFGLANDLALNPKENGEMPAPHVGLVTSLYRIYTPPTGGEKYGNTIISKFAVKEGKPNLPGDYKEMPEELAVSIYEEYQKSDKIEGSPF